LRKRLNNNLIDSISPYSAPLKTGNGLVTEKQRKRYDFAFFGLRQRRTTATYTAKYQRVHSFSQSITFFENLEGKCTYNSVIAGIPSIAKQSERKKNFTITKEKTRKN
jgi:hypothetical protein